MACDGLGGLSAVERVGCLAEALLNALNDVRENMVANRVAGEMGDDLDMTVGNGADSVKSWAVRCDWGVKSSKWRTL